MFIGNSTTTKSEEFGKISPKIIFLKFATITALLFKNWFICVFFSDKIVIRKNKMYIGKGYLT